MAETLGDIHCQTKVKNGLVYIDLADEAYAALLHAEFLRADSFHSTWFEEQALLASILLRKHGTTTPAPDKPLLRKAMLACAHHEKAFRAFCKDLRVADAHALRNQNAASCHACAFLCSLWLWEHKRIGTPSASIISLPSEKM